jgi:hypothetical protein
MGRAFLHELRDTALALAPAIGLILVFQVAFLRMPLEAFLPILVGLACTVFGFTLFIQGAKLGLLPLGQGIGTAFIERRALSLLLLFGLLLGVVLTIAEPDVRLLARQMEDVLGASGSRTTLILVGALGLGAFGVIALLRIAADVRTRAVLVPGYLLCTALMLVSSEEAVTQAYDMGAVTTGPMTVPFLLALGVGMAAVLGGRDPVRTGFGFMAIGSIGPVLAILIWHLAGGAR